MQQRHNSDALVPIWNQLMGLAGAVGELRGRVTRLERLYEREHPTSDPYGQTRTGLIMRALGHTREVLGGLLWLLKVLRRIPWGPIALLVTATWKWLAPQASRWLGLS